MSLPIFTFLVEHAKRSNLQELRVRNININGSLSSAKPVLIVARWLVLSSPVLQSCVRAQIGEQSILPQTS